MKEISATFDFVKSVNWQEAANAATGDVSSLVMLVMLLVVGLAGIIFVMSRSLATTGKHINNKERIITFGNMQLSKMSIAVITAILAGLIGLCAFGANKAIANADSNQQIYNFSNTKVSVSNNGIDVVEPVILENLSDKSLLVNSIKLNLNEQSAKNSTWTIKHNEIILYKNNPNNEWVSLDEAITIEPHAQLKLDVDIKIDANIAIALIDKTPVSVSLLMCPFTSCNLNVKGNGKWIENGSEVTSITVLA